MIQLSRSRQRLLVLFILALAAISVPGALAQTKSFNWADWQVAMEVQTDGSMLVTETQTLNFAGAPFTFGYREIPTGRAGNNDGIRDVSVREGDLVYRESSSQQPGTFEVVDSGNMTRINWYFEPAIGSRTYTFSYVVDGAVRAGTMDEGSGDQVYWTVIPIDIPSYVQQTRATIRLPEGVRPQQYTGTEEYLVEAYINDVPSDAVDITVSDDGSTITYELNEPIVPGERLDVRVQFPHGLIAAETPAWQAQEQRSDVIGLAVLALSLLFLIGGPLLVLLLWFLRGRDPQIGVIVPEYISEPPDDLPPAMAGAIIDEKVDMQDIMSTLTDLANRGYLTMTEEKKDFTFTRTEKSDADLRPYEQKMLRRLFMGEKERALKSLQYKFARNLDEIRDEIYTQLETEDLVPRSPNVVRNRYSAMAFTLLVLGIMVLFGLSFVLGENVGLICIPGIALLLTSIVLLITSRHMPTKTVKGAEAAAKWRAFKQYLTNIDEYGDLVAEGNKFGKYLPYAVAFGLERSFIKKFSEVPTAQMPPWYMPYPPIMTTGWGGGMGRPVVTGSPGGMPSAGGGMSMPRPSLEGMSGNLAGGLAGMSAGLTRMLNSTSTVLKSTPPPAQSSSRSGSFGGGFSSGGFSGGFSGGSSGGGGGGGFG